jgi:hypothetical protein
MKMSKGDGMRCERFGGAFLLCMAGLVMTGPDLRAANNEPILFYIGQTERDAAVVSLQGDTIQVAASERGLNAAKKVSGTVRDRGAGKLISFLSIEVPCSLEGVTGLIASLYYQEDNKGRPYMGAATYLSMKDEKDGEWTYSSNFFQPLTKSLLIRPVSAKDLEFSIAHTPNKENKKMIGVGIQVRSGSVYIKEIRKGKELATASVTVTGPDGKAVSSVQKTLSSLGYG